MDTSQIVFVHHEPCPKCGSRDNLGVWSDGHKYCFGCGHVVLADGSFQQLVRKNLGAKEESKKTSVVIPVDSTVLLPAEIENWLKQYEIDSNDCKKYDLRYSFSERGLVIPFYNDKRECIFYQIRHFYRQGEAGPKYTTKGSKKEAFTIFGEANGDFVVLVEDAISAIKVSKVVESAYCLFGTHLSSRELVELSRRFGSLYIWLDPDGPGKSAAMKIFEHAEPVFDSVHIIESYAGDPKAHTETEILDLCWSEWEKYQDDPKWDYTKFNSGS